MFIFWLSFWNVIVLNLVFCKMNFPHLTSFDQIVRTEIEYENRWDNYELRILPRFVKLGKVIFLQKCNAKIELSYQTRFPEWEKNHFGLDLRNKHHKKTKPMNQMNFSIFSMFFRSESSFRAQAGTEGSFFSRMSQRFGKFGQTWSIFVRSQISVFWSCQKWTYIMFKFDSFTQSHLHSLKTFKGRICSRSFQLGITKTHQNQKHANMKTNWTWRSGKNTDSQQTFRTEKNEQIVLTCFNMNQNEAG